MKWETTRAHTFRKRHTEDRRRQDAVLHQGRSLAKRTVKIDVQPLPEVVEKAVAALNARELADYQPSDFGERRLHTIVVNYLRHVHTNYEEHVAEANRRDTPPEGSTQAVLKFRRRVLRKIASIYPELETECERQIKTFERHAIFK